MTENTHTSRCEISGEIISYMYGELPVSERLAFEEHLVSCTACTDEFAEIADARFSVYEWRRVEFEALSTPEIVIPCNAAAASSWFGKLREAFSFAPAWASVGLSSAAAAVLFAVGLTAYQSQSGNDVVANTANIDGAEAVAAKPSAVAERPAESESTESIDVIESRKSTLKPGAASNRVRMARTATSRPSKAVQGTMPVPQRTRPEQAVDRRQPDRLPTFTEYSEQEDETLRLAELFDDIDTSE